MALHEIPFHFFFHYRIIHIVYWSTKFDSFAVQRPYSRDLVHCMSLCFNSNSCEKYADIEKWKWYWIGQSEYSNERAEKTNRE